MFKPHVQLLVAAALLLGAGSLCAQTTWNGGTTDWNTASNWSAGVPTSTTDATISGLATTMPTLVAGAACKSLTINSGATLNGSTGTLSVNGDWTNNGTYSTGTAVITFATAVNATIGGTTATTFYRLVLSKTSRTYTLTMNSNVTVSYTSTSALDLQAGTFITNWVTTKVSRVAGGCSVAGGPTGDAHACCQPTA